ncbi:carbon-nitrogen hydrolase family protein [Phytoactinopolyspora alkaliphila]|uniref:Carbon-nitrogen hydrolase family protein n=1 Tax=Phytoactinopolyspora alkaliphila TaxID=1783498 RepID=A0A6N9YU17_9ACTN|nr:carbon-nitrogen hydrolase family protein [Phytoactinopolyspora alkaliphila]NED98430.1 carbon-nitrogen hydrolase family protein [Phytoactinopolyspora alkaliphila]
MRVALVQMAAGVDPDENVATMRRLTSGVRADLIVFPEAAMHDFGKPDMPLGPVAQPLDGPFVDAASRIAASASATVIAGMFERSTDPDRPFNTLVAVAPDGSIAATYRKAHLYDSFGYRESDRLLAGDAVPATVDLGGLRFGLLTCYDLRFPEHSRALVQAGADALVMPAAWVRGPLKEDHWVTLARARAIENTVYVAAAAQCGRAYCGRSMLVDPLGVAVAASGDEEGVIHGRIEPAGIAAARERNPALQHQRVWPGFGHHG